MIRLPITQEILNINHQRRAREDMHPVVVRRAVERRIVLGADEAVVADVQRWQDLAVIIVVALQQAIGTLVGWEDRAQQRGEHEDVQRHEVQDPCEDRG